MKKRVLINRDNIRKIVNDRLNNDGNFISESKIDKAIKDYLIERGENDSNGEDGYSFSPKVKLAFTDMSKALTNIVEDLKIIQIKEPDVLVDYNGDGELYSEEVLEQIITELENTIESLDFLVILRK